MTDARPRHGRHTHRRHDSIRTRILDTIAALRPYRPQYAIDDEPVKAPGFAALMRRHPNSARQGGAAAIACGLIVFAVASAVDAGADPTAHTAHLPTIAAPVLPTDTGPSLDVLTPSAGPVVAPVVVKTVKPSPVAPVDNAAISSLAANGIPTVALNAYRVAAARMAHVDPSCGIDWALLAGIGREESDHGQFAGAVLHADGVSTPRIIGIPLNGHGTALILDTDHGRLDGDTVYDHAVGPMQFIPSTWAIYGTDANGDGIADPFNINDAALTSARYLCAAGGNLRTRAGQVAAVLAYNHSDVYLAQVLALADAYRRGISISGIPLGNVSGALPPVHEQGAPPPANPGAPTANSTGASAPKPKPTTSTSPTGGHGTGGTTSGSTTTTGASGGSTPPAESGSTTPADPGTSSAPPSSGGASSSPVTPSPSPSTTKCAVPDLLNPGKCAIP